MDESDMYRARAYAKVKEIPTRRTRFAAAGTSKAGFTGAGGLAGDGLGRIGSFQFLLPPRVVAGRVWVLLFGYALCLFDFLFG